MNEFDKKIDNIEKLAKEAKKLVESFDFSEHDKIFLTEIKALKKHISDLESKGKVELPFDPLETANYLINATYERETNVIERAVKNLPEKVNSDRYTVDDLEQIAEHLLVYCRHNKE